MTAPWLTARTELEVLDCTIRDGGLTNSHQFEDGFVRAVYEALVESGVDYMEIGYKGSKKAFSVDEFGPWKFCDEKDLRRVIPENNTPLKITVMADAGKSDWQTDIIPADESIIDMIRVAFYAHQISEASEMIQDACEKGYIVSANLMAVSTNTEEEIDTVMEEVGKTDCKFVSVVDSFGSLYAEQIERLVKRYREMTDPRGKIISVHAHNNQQLAFANSIEAVIHGANSVDASIGGLGRGAGNCPMELLLGFLRNPKFQLRPIYKVLQDQILPLSKTVEWGPYPEYYITGQLNLHPRDAIAARAGEDCGKYVEFYDRMTNDD